MPTLGDLKVAVEEYTTYSEPTFLVSINSFIRAAEERIWFFVQLPNFRKNLVSSFTLGAQYQDLPQDFLASASLAAILPSGEYVYLLNKDVDYIRAVYPNPTTRGEPTHYALFTADNAMTQLLIGPTPDLSYGFELNYFYRPESLTEGDIDANTTWLSVHAYDTLLYGALSEAANWMKKSAGIDGMGDTYEQRFVLGLQGLKNLGESRDRKDTYRSGEKRTPE